MLASSRLHDCGVWRGKPKEEKLDILLKANGCVLCCSWTHKKDDCNASIKTCAWKVGGAVCGQAHNKAFHGITHASLNLLTVNAANMLGKDAVLLQLMQVDITKNISTTIFFNV